MHGHIASLERPAKEPHPSPAPTAGPFDGSVEPTIVWKILWRRRVWIAATAAACALAAAIYCVATPSQYTATAQILVDPRDRQVLSNDVNPSELAADGGLTQVESQASVVQSSGVLLRAMAAEHLETDPEFDNSSSLAGRLLALISSPNAESAEEDRKAKTLAALRKRLAVKRADKVLVIDVGVATRDPDKSARIANAIADAYLADQAEARSRAGREASAALAARLGELQRHVRDAENALEDYRAENHLVVSSGQLVSDQALNETTAQLSAAQSRTAELKARLDHRKGAKLDGEGTPEATQSAVVTRLRERESALVEKVSDLHERLGPRHPDYLAAEAALKHVRDLISREVGRLGDSTRAEYDRAVADERAIATRLEGMKAKSLEDDKADVRLHELERQLDAERSVYASFLVRSKETAEQANVDSTNARIITRALRPQQKSWPPTVLLVAGAALVGLGLGGSASLAREYVAPVVMSPAQASALLDAPALAIFPPAAAQGEARERAARRLLANLFRRKADPGRYDAKCLLLTSAAADSAERAQVARALAAAAVRLGKQVLLIEGEDDERQGLAQLLSGERTHRALAESTPAGYLRIGKGLPPQQNRSSPTKESDGSPFERTLRSFDLTIVDAAPLSQNFVAANVAAEADAILLVVRLGETSHAAVAGEAESAAAAGGRVGGIVLIDPALRA